MSRHSAIRGGPQILRAAGRRSGYKGFKSQPICFHCLVSRRAKVGRSSKMKIVPAQITLSFLATSYGSGGLWVIRILWDRPLHSTATPTQLSE